MAYDSDAGQILVRFPNGVEWFYADCSPMIWEEFTSGISKGRYIREVLDNHRHGRLN